MATLQSFQVEIEDIRNRELAKARAQSQPEAPKKGHADQRSAPKARKKTVGGETPATSPTIPKFVNDESTYDLTDIEHSIEARHTYTPSDCHSFSPIPIVQSAPLNPAGGDTQARDLIAALLTRQGGEYILRLGARPPRAPLFTNEDFDNVNDWTGDRRTEGEIDAKIAHLGQLVEEVGGKVLSAVNGSSLLS
jgi:hypothetical protein